MKVLRIAAAATLALGSAGVTPDSAGAAACTGQVRYASSTNTIYLTSGTATPTDIKTLCPSAPLTLVSSGLWQLDADLVIQNGARLTLKGTAVGGDVDTLRLRSAAGNLKTEVTALTAQYGTITIDHVAVTSWDPAAGGPDTNASLPPGATSTDRARAFIRVISYLDGGTPRESRMDITDSDLGYLGWHAAESYGVSYKGRGCDADNIPACDALNVYGKQLRSRFHHNYFGVYTYNAKDMDFIDNEYDDNIAYGLDPHDDSDHLTITGNHFHHNGNHGVICSQRCDHLLISGNESDHNGIPPYVPEGDDDPSDNQVHGIMIHRGVTDTVIENNDVHDQPNGAGIAVFDSVGNTVRNNTVTGARYGLRYSVGTRDTQTTGNVVTGSGQYAVFTYKGSDQPVYTGTSGRPSDLVFSANTFDGSESNIVKINDAEGVSFTGNTFTGAIGSARMQNSVGTSFGGNTVPSSLLYSTVGSAATASTTVFPSISGATKVGVDAYSTVKFTNADGTVYSGTAPTALTASGGLLTLASAEIGASPATISPTQVKAVPASGTATARVAGSASSVLHAYVNGSAGVALSFTVGGLTAGTTYRVTAGGTTVATATANASGVVTFSVTPTTSAEVDYQISATS